MTCKSFDECELHAEPEDDIHVSGAGTTLERNWKCEKCGRRWRQVWNYYGLIDNDTEETIRWSG